MQSIAPPIRFTELVAPTPLTKSIWIENGALKKSPPHKVGSGVATAMTMTLADLPDYLSAADPCACIVNGLSGKPQAEVVPENKRKPGQISRTKRTAPGKGFFDFFAGPGLVMIDHDPHPANPHPYVTPAQLTEIITRVFPAYARAAKVYDYSASAEIYDAQGNRVSGPEPGHHTLLAVQDARDIPRFGEVLFKRLALAGYGYPVLSASGALLRRGIIDAAVFSPERVIFNAKPTLGPGLVHRKPAPEYIHGEALDTHLLPNLSAQDEARFHALVEQWRRDMQPHVARKKQAHAQTIATRKKIPVSDALKEIELRHAGVIHPDTQVQVEATGNVVQLRSLVDEIRKTGRSIYILDPDEPEIGHAVVMASKGKAYVRTFLHGGGDLHVSPDCRHYYGSKIKIPAEAEAHALGLTGPRFERPEYVQAKEIERLVGDAVRDIIENPTTPDGKPRVVVLLVSAGGGKTYQTWVEIGKHLKNGFKVAGYVPTTELGREIEKTHGFPKAIRGRANTACNMNTPCRIIGQLHEAGVDEVTIQRCWRSIGSLCGKPDKPEDRCRWYNQCSYNRQYWDAERQNVRLYAHNGLNQKKPAIDRLKPDLAVIDEQFLDEMVQTGKISAEAILKTEEPVLMQLQAAVERAMRDELPVLDTVREMIPDALNVLKDLKNEVAPKHPKLWPNMQPAEIAMQFMDYKPAPSWFGLVLEVIRMLESGAAHTQRLYVRGTTKDGVWIPSPRREIEWCRKRDLEQIQGKPLLILDASVNREVVTRFFPHAEFITIRAPRRYKKVIQILSGEITNQQLLGLSTANQPNDRAQHHAQLFRDRLKDTAGMLTKMLGKGMVCGPKPFMEAMDLPDDQKRWFGNLRGIDAHKNDKWAAIAGRHQKPPHVAEAYARAIFDDDEQPLKFGFGKRPAGIRMRDGSTRYVRANYHIDDRVQAVEDLFRERETEQGVDRPRVIHDDAECLLIFSCLPLDVTVDMVVENREDLLGDARFNKLALGHNTIPMAAAWLNAARPDLFPSAKSGNEWWKKFKGSSVLYDYIGRESLSKITYRVTGQRGGKPTPAVTFRQYMEDAQADLEALLGCAVTVEGLPSRPLLTLHPKEVKIDAPMPPTDTARPVYAITPGRTVPYATPRPPDPGIQARVAMI